MNLKDFKTEQWMNDYENDAVYNLTDTCVSPLTLRQLMDLDQDHLLDDMKLDYGVITGDERLKKEILKLYDTGTVDNITLYHGCLEANEEVMLNLLDPGDRVIVFTPGYQQFSDLPRAVGCSVTEVRLCEEENWQPDQKQLNQALSSPFRMIIINNPANPTGTLFSKECLQQMIHAAEQYDAWILSDEVYRGLLKEEPSISDLYRKGISTSSFSKVFSLAGLRLGWVKGNKEIIHRLNVSRDYTVISTGPLADTLGLIALAHQDELLDRSRKIVKTNKTIVEEWLKKEKRCSIHMPAAGTVGFLKYEGPDSISFAAGILKKYGVFFVPGSCFDCENHLRLGFTCSHETMKKGLELLGRYLDETA